MSEIKLRVDDSLKNELQEIAKRENRSLNNYIDTILKKHISGMRVFNELQHKHFDKHFNSDIGA